MTAYSVEDSTVVSVVINLTSSFARTNNQLANTDQSMSCAQNESEEFKSFYLTAQFITGLIAYPILCIIGITSNIVSLVVFKHRDMRTSTNVYLMSLAVSDTIKLLIDTMYFIIVAVSLRDTELSERMMSSAYPVAHYVFNMSVCVTSWLTVSVAVERFISVCYASRARELCTVTRARYVCSFVFVFMSLLAIPSALRYEMRTVQDKKLNTTCTLVVPTELGMNNSFMIPYSWILNSSRGIIPVFILVFLNARIINELRKERIKGKKFSARNRITLMLTVVVFMFLVCVTPDAVMSTFFGKGYVEENYLVKGVREITDTLLAVNSACSFFLYFTMSTVFRATFFKIFCRYLQRTQDSESILLNRKVSSQKGRNETVEFVVSKNGCTAKSGDRDSEEDFL